MWQCGNHLGMIYSTHKNGDIRDGFVLGFYWVLPQEYTLIVMIWLIILIVHDLVTLPVVIGI